MSHRQTRMERADEGSFPYWGALIEEKCIGANFHVHQEFCRTHGLSLSKYGPAVVWQHEWYQVFRFARPEDASEKGKGKNWAQWRKGSHKP